MVLPNQRPPVRLVQQPPHTYQRRDTIQQTPSQIKYQKFKQRPNHPPDEQGQIVHENVQQQNVGQNLTTGPQLFTHSNV